MRITFDGSEFAGKEFGNFLEIFELLTEEELDPLLVFLASPYFNDDVRVAKLYRRILESRRSGAERINGRPLLRFVFGKMPDKKAKTLLRKFLKCLPDLMLTYIEHQELKTNRRLGGRVSVFSLKKRIDSRFFQKAATQMEKTISGMTPTLMQFEAFWWLYHQQYFHQYTQQYHADGTAHLVQANQHLQLFYQLSSLRYYCEVLNREKILGKEEAFQSLKDGMGKFIDEEHPLPIITFYSRLARLLQFPKDPKIYERFKTYYAKHQQELAQADRLVMIKSVFNVWIRNYEAGLLNGPFELLHWAREGVATGDFLFESSLSDKEYLNIAIAAGLAGDLDFMETYVEDYKKELEESIQEQAYQMALIYLDFFRKEPEKVLKRLEAHFPVQKSFDHIYTMRVKVMYIVTYLMCYIELEENSLNTLECEDKFSAQNEAYRQWINRAVFLDQQRRIPHKNFHDFCNKIYRYAAGNPDHQTQEKKSALLSEVKQEDYLVGRHVLILMIENLKAR